MLVRGNAVKPLLMAAFEDFARWKADFLLDQR